MIKLYVCSICLPTVVLFFMFTLIFSTFIGSSKTELGLNWYSQHRSRLRWDLRMIFFFENRTFTCFSSSSSLSCLLHQSHIHFRLCLIVRGERIVKELSTSRTESWTFEGTEMIAYYYLSAYMQRKFQKTLIILYEDYKHKRRHNHSEECTSSTRNLNLKTPDEISASDTQAKARLHNTRLQM